MLKNLRSPTPIIDAVAVDAFRPSAKDAVGAVNDCVVCILFVMSSTTKNLLVFGANDISFNFIFDAVIAIDAETREAVIDPVTTKPFGKLIYPPNSDVYDDVVENDADVEIVALPDNDPVIPLCTANVSNLYMISLV